VLSCSMVHAFRLMGFAWNNETVKGKLQNVDHYLYRVSSGQQGEARVKRIVWKRMFMWKRNVRVEINSYYVFACQGN
jgi:hypothetical protein